MKVKVLMIAEIELDDLFACDILTADAYAQERLDAFRESVLPNEYGISLYRADKDIVMLANTFDEEGIYNIEEVYL
jgi:hypothetical protein